MKESIYKVGDRVIFNRADGSTCVGYIVAFYDDGSIQISDNGKLTGQNWGVQEKDIIGIEG